MKNFKTLIAVVTICLVTIFTQSVFALDSEANFKEKYNLEIGTDVQAYDADLTTFAAITPAANVQSILGAADYAAIKALLDLEIGTDVQAQDATLQSIVDDDDIVPVAILIDVSADETTDLTTGTAKITFRAPYAFTLTDVRATVTLAPTDATIIVDVNEGGTSVLSTEVSIDATELTSTTAATPAVISDSAIADDAQITIDVDQIGSTIAGDGLKVWLIGTTSM